MSKDLEELKEVSENEENFRSLRLQDFVIYYIVPVLEDFEKRLIELEKDKTNILEHHEINETGGIDNIKIILHDPNLKERR